MERFHEILPGIHLLKTPFSTIWSGVFLVECEEGRVLVDSCVSAASVDEQIIPALKEMGLELTDITWLINTHSHGDHMGGNDRILQLAPGIQLAAFKGAENKIAEPLPHSIITRAKYPGFSPAPPKEFPGHQPDLVLDAGQVLGGRLRIVHTPGHDTECISLLDLKTNTLLTGDSIQGFGMIGPDGAGVAFYKDLPAYQKSLKDVRSLDVENIVASHDFRPMGCMALGREEVRVFLDLCELALELYDVLVKRMVKAGITEPDQVALGVLDAIGVEPPPYLFQPMYTVDEHIPKCGK